MALSTRVIVNGITNLHEARYCAGMGVEFIGFPLYGEETLPSETVNEIIGWLSGVDFIGEVKSAYPLEKGAYNVQYLMTDEYNYVKTLSTSSGLPVIYKKKCNANNIEELLEEFQSLKTTATYFVIELQTLEESLLERIKNLDSKFAIFVASAYDENTALEIIHLLQPEGIAIQAESKEIKVGYNDFDSLAEILEAIELDD